MLKEKLNSLVSIIVKTGNANEVILFGSQATGNANEYSDIDLCVISDNVTERRPVLLRSIYREISHIQNTPVDIVLYHKNDFYERAETSNTFENRIMREGVKLYGHRCVACD